MSSTPEPSDPEVPPPGTRVRVHRDCPHTLPAYARMLDGEVLRHTEDGLVLIRFGEDREFPVPPDCVEALPDR